MQDPEVRRYGLSKRRSRGFRRLETSRAHPCSGKAVWLIEEGLSMSSSHSATPRPDGSSKVRKPDCQLRGLGDAVVGTE